MIPTRIQRSEAEETPVDDVRRVRQMISEECGDDINRLADYATRMAEEVREELGLRRVREEPSKSSPH